MRLTTWNVLWRFRPDWRARERALLAVLNDVRPDVLALQECWEHDGRPQADVVAEHLGGYATFVGPSLPPVPDPPEHDEQRGVRMGLGLVTRRPPLAVREHVLPVSHRQVAPVALEAHLSDTDGRRFDVLVAATEWEPAYADDHLAQTRRLAELLTDAPHPRFLLADLNADTGMPELAPLLAVADDAYALGGGDPAAVTLSREVPFAPLEATKEMDRRIDHVLVAHGSGVRVRDAFVVTTTVEGTYPSDHFPVVVDVDLPGR